MSWEEILWQRSFVNLQMLLSAIPETDFDEEGGTKSTPGTAPKKDEALEAFFKDC